MVATVTPENATDKSVTWSSDRTDIAAVDNAGKVTAVKTGTAHITLSVPAGTKAAYQAHGLWGMGFKIVERAE